MNFRKKSKGIFLFLLLLVNCTVFGQSYFSGEVIDAKGEKVIGASIQLSNQTIIAITDKNGAFFFNSTVPSIQVTVMHLSFEPQTVKLEADKKARIELMDHAYVSDEVNIVATRVNNRTGAAFQNIDKAELAKSNLGQDLPILLNYTPSLVTTSDAGSGVGYTGLRIRGSDATRINVTMNGIPVNDAESHGMYWVDLPDLASSVDNIQIQRGVGSSTNGAGAFGGSVNIQTNKLNPKPYASIQSSAGSFNTFKNTVSFGSGLLGKYFAVEGRLSKITSDGYIDRATSDLKSFYFSGGYYGKKNSLRAVVLSGKEKTYQAWYGVPKDSLKTNRRYNPAGEYYDANGNVKYYPNQTDNYRQDYYQLFYTHEFNTAWNANVGLHYTKGKGYYEEFAPGGNLVDYNLTPVITPTDTIVTTDITRQKWLDNDFYGLTYSLQYRNDKTEIIFGGAANEYKGKHFNEVINSGLTNLTYPFRYFYDEAVKKDINSYVKASWFVMHGLTVWIDLQYRNIDYNYTGNNSSFTAKIPRTVNLNFFNPKAGISFQLLDYELYLTYAKAHKEPTRDDYLAASTDQLPNPENLNDLEVGYRYKKSAYRASVNVYFMQYQSQLILNGRLNAEGEAIRESVPNSYRYGIEGESSYDNGKMFAYTFNLSLSRNIIKEYTEYVDDYDGGPQIINTYKNTTISYSPSAVGAAIFTIRPIKHLSIDICNKYVGMQYLDNTADDTRKLNAYYVNDLRLGYSITGKKVKSVEFRLLINNLFNNEYIANGATYNGYSGGVRYNYNYFYPQATRNWLGGVVISL